jgi:signal peptidase I
VYPVSEPTPETPPVKPANVKAEFTELVKMVVWFLVLFFVLKWAVIEGYEVQGPSMEPTLWNNERILVFKLPHNISRLFSSYQPIQPGDIVVFKRPEDNNKRYVKRVVAEGLPRESSNTVDAQGREDSGPKTVSLRIERGKVFVNNQRFEESYLPVEIEESFDDTDRADLKPGEYYVMGDHRSVSKDSRVFGPINDDKVIGKAILRFWPLSRFGLLK